jgi:hypothetical protein
MLSKPILNAGHSSLGPPSLVLPPSLCLFLHFRALFFTLSSTTQAANDRPLAMFLVFFACFVLLALNCLLSKLSSAGADCVQSVASSKSASTKPVDKAGNAPSGLRCDRVEGIWHHCRINSAHRPRNEVM